MAYRVSVITSIYKSSEFLFDFLIDAKRQSIFPETEVLLLDCNEDDADFKIIEQFLPNPNLHYYRIGKCSVYEAWNTGVALSSAPLLTNWNTDDRRAFDSLERQVKHMEAETSCDVCYGPTVVSVIPNEVFEYCSSNKLFPALEGTLENQMRHNSPHCLPVWRKSIHEKLGGFDTQYFSAADYDMWFRVLRDGGRLDCLPDPVGLYYRNPIGISSNQKTLDKAFKEVIDIRKKYA